MVMNARKLPRLNDGLYEKRGHPPPFEQEKGTSNNKAREGYNDKYAKKEASTSNYRDGEKYPRKYDDRNKDHKRNNSNDKTYNHSKDSSSNANRHSSNHSAEKGKPLSKEQVDIKKTALRICNEWSEHLSSSGKPFFYNSASGESKWEKPKGWSDLKAVTTEYGKKQEAKESSKGSDWNYRHGSRRPRDDRGGNNSCAPRGTSAERQRPREGDRRHHAPDRRRSPRSNDRGRERPGRTSVTPGASSSSSATAARKTPSNGSLNRHYQHKPERAEGLPSNNTGSNTHGGEESYSRHSDDMDISPSSTPTEESQQRLAGVSFSTPVSTVAANSSAPPHAPSPIVTTSGILETSSVSSTLPSLPAAINQALQQSLASSGGTEPSNQQEFTQAAIQTLQRLHEVLLAQQQQQQVEISMLISNELQHQQHAHSPASLVPNSTPCTYTTPSSSSIALASSLLNGPTPRRRSLALEEDMCSEGTPVHSPELHLPEDTPDRSRRQSQDDSRLDSPTPSQSSSQRGSITLAGSPATETRQEALHLPAYLANHYRPELIGHAVGWPGHHFERQAEDTAQEGLDMDINYIGRVATELKNSRSFVRVLETQATLQEQRIFFLRQQIETTESSKNQSSFFVGGRESSKSGGKTPTSSATGGSSRTPTSSATGGSSRTPTSSATGGSSRTPTSSATGGSSRTPTSSATGGSSRTPTSSIGSSATT